MKPIYFNLEDLNSSKFETLTTLLKKSQIGIFPVDTIYGIICLSQDKKAVERVYDLKKREKQKPMIVLISSLSDLNIFKIKVDQKTTQILNTLWPNPVSAILPCPYKEFEFLHRGSNTLAIRFPKHQLLQKIIKKIGPIVATSANLSGENPISNIKLAQKIFRDQVNFYVDGGEITSIASTLVEIKKGQIQIIRQGEFKIDKQ